MKSTTFLRTLLPILTFVATISYNICDAKSTVRVSREEYINRYKHIAIDHQRRYGIPASITMAQGILESDCGNSNLAKGSNNHFGIKCKDYWTGRTYTHTDDAPDECFRAYDTVEESYQDHAEFLHSSPRYDSLFDFKPTDYRSWARGLKAAGYATAKDYAERLVKLIEDNNLDELDKQGGNTKRPSVKSVTIAKGGGVDPNKFGVSISSKGGYNLYRINKTVYVEAKAGDTYASIGKVFKLSGGSLCTYNDTKGRRTELGAGERVYIESKRKKWSGKEKEYRVKSGESVRYISQIYGIKEKSLRKLNKLKNDDTVSAGQVIRIR